MADQLKTKTIRALVWSFIESSSSQIIQFVIGVILARLIMPSEFGLIGMLTIFIAISQAFLNSGFGTALIQKNSATQLDICSIFYFNIVMGFLITIILYFAAPLIASFYKQPQLLPLTRFLSLVILINAFGVIQTTLIAKSINFKILAYVTAVTSILSGLIGVYMAIKGFGVWSLATQQVARSFFSTLSLWFFNRWRPRLQFSFRSLKEMFGFGSRMLFSELLNQIFNNIYYVVIGRLFTTTDLGYFTRARTLEQLPTRSIANMVGRVTFPVFATIQDDVKRIKNGMKKALTLMALVNFPLMIGMAVTAKSLIVVLFTEKWLPIVPYFQLLCFTGFLFPLHLINLNVLKSIGRSDLFFRLEIFKKITIVVAIIITYRFGISIMIVGMCVSSIINYYVNSYYTAQIIKYGVFEQLKDLLNYFIVAIIMGGISYSAGYILIKNPIVILVVQILTGVISYFILCFTFQLQAFLDGINIMKKQIGVLKNRFGV